MLLYYLVHLTACLCHHVTLKAETACLHVRCFVWLSRGRCCCLWLACAGLARAAFIVNGLHHLKLMISGMPFFCTCRRKALAVYPVLLMFVSIGWLALVKSG